MATATNSHATVAPTQPADSTEVHVPLVRADKALLSLRSSGHDFSSAVGEVIDNSLEAGANVIRIRTFSCMKKIGNSARNAEVIERVAIGDDGEGMEYDVLHRALQLGYSTRYNSRKGLGRFGVGAKLGGISQVKRIEYYSRQSDETPWRVTCIDLDDIQGGQDRIPAPEPDKLPADCVDLVGEEHGTLVVWSNADRLQERETGGARKATTVENELIAYIGRTFRKFLDAGKQIWVNDLRVRPHDPLYLMTSTRFHEPAERIAVTLDSFPSDVKIPDICKNQLSFSPKARQLVFHGQMTEKQRDALLSLVDDDVFLSAVAKKFKCEPTDSLVDDFAESLMDAINTLHERSNPDPVATVVHTNSFEFDVPNHPGQTSPVEVTITLLPNQFWERDKHSDRPGGSPHAKARAIDKNEGVSILRAGREIFFGRLREVQPQAREIDRFIGVEIRFRPDLDECFQVRNVKKGAEPVNGLRDKLKSEIYSTVATARKHIKARYDHLKASETQDNGIHRRAEDVVESARDVAPQPRAGKKLPDEERDRRLKDAAAAVTRDKPHKAPDVAKEMMKRPLSFVPQAWPGNDFIQIDHLGETAIVRLNTQHPFYTEVYSKLVDAMEGRGDGDPVELARLVQVGLDLLLSSYAQAESVEEDAEEKYANLRTYWGLHLKNNVQKWTKSHG